MGIGVVVMVVEDGEGDDEGKEELMLWGGRPLLLALW
jgi:hypothetical protein